MLLANRLEHIYYHEHLGRKNYLSIMKGSELVLGNSSSGIFEAPSFGITSINIGNRQYGRERAGTTIDVPCISELIIKCVRESTQNCRAISPRDIANPYDPFLDGKNSLRVANACINALTDYSKEELLNKKFSQNIQSLDWNKLINNMDS